MKKISKKTPLIIITFMLLVTPQLVLAQYSPMIRIPGLEDAGNINLEAYLEIIYVLAIVGAAFIAVGKLMLAGIRYIGSDIVSDKAKAKAEIKSAILGLAVILLATTILRTINPDLVNITNIPNAPSFENLHRPTALTVRVGDQFDLLETNHSFRELAKACAEDGGKLTYDGANIPLSGTWSSETKGVTCVRRTSGADTFFDRLEEFSSTTPEEREVLEDEYAGVVEGREVDLSHQELTTFLRQAQLTLAERGVTPEENQAKYRELYQKSLDAGLNPSEARQKANIELALSYILFVNTGEINTDIEARQRTLCERAGASYENFGAYRICF